MPTSSGLHGPFALTRADITTAFSGVGPGAYILGSTNAKNGIGVRYVGRSDSDLIDRLCQHADIGKYTHFKAGFLNSAIDAYHKECWLFHTFGELLLDNECHPDHPDNIFQVCVHPGCNF